jgi:lipopolysaccharide transport system permease protein
MKETRVIAARPGWRALELGELWRHRELLFLLAARDIQVRYKQTLLGVGWAVLPPLCTTLVFALLFDVLLGKNQTPTITGVPYALSTYCALVPWQLFARVFSAAGNSLVANRYIITKVYFPRLIAPLAPAAAALIDFAVAFVGLLLLMALYGVSPSWHLLAAPLFTALTVLTALAVALWLSALNAIYRDVAQIMPVLLQLWLFVTPVLYTSTSVVAHLPPLGRWLYAMNPMLGAVEGFRWSLLGGEGVAADALALSCAVVLVLLVGGLYFFRRMEQTLVDVL